MGLARFSDRFYIIRKQIALKKPGFLDEKLVF